MAYIPTPTSFGPTNATPILQATGNKLQFLGDNVSGAAASTNLLTIPVSINVFGALSNLMGAPNLWINVLISGSAYKIPVYT